MSAPRAIVVADDLTGAADTGAPFAAAGFATAVPLRSTPPGAEVIALSNDTRDASADRIDRLFEQSMELLPPTNGSTVWYAKVDSVFRGYPGPQVAFLLRQTGQRAVIIAPALPDQGRVTVDGNVYVDDVLLTRTALGTGRSSAAVVELLRLPRDLGSIVDLKTVRSGERVLREAIAHAEHPIVVVDAETNEDLAILADAVIDGTSHLLAGSAGFSKQIALRLAERSGKAPATGLSTPARSVLTVAGSRHDATTRQVDALAASGVETVRVSFVDGHPDPHIVAGALDRLEAALRAGHPATLTTSGTPRSTLPGQEIARTLAVMATDPRLRDACDAMILTGGDVAASVCVCLEAEAIWLGGEVLSAIPWGTLHGGIRPDMPIVTKAGSFGDDSAMVDTIAFLTKAVPIPEA